MDFFVARPVQQVCAVRISGLHEIYPVPQHRSGECAIDVPLFSLPRRTIQRGSAYLGFRKRKGLHLREMLRPGLEEFLYRFVLVDEEGHGQTSSNER